MSRSRNYERWRLPSEELDAPTAIRARDLMVECFLEAQKEVFASAVPSQVPPIERTKAMVKEAVRLAFEETGANFDTPSKQDLEHVLETLTRKASSWGTPEAIIEHHRNQLKLLFERI